MGILKRGKTWYVDYYQNGERIREKIGVKKTDAEKVLRERLTARDQGKNPILKERRKITFKDFALVYFERHSKNKRSVQTDASLLSRLCEYFGGLSIDQISRDRVALYRAKRLKDRHQRIPSKSVSPATVNRELAILRGVMNKAVEWDYLSFNPVSRIKMSREEPKERLLSENERSQLIRCADGVLKDFILVALNTGMRSSEIRGLRWAQVNLDAASIRVEKTKNNRVRHVPMNETVLNLFWTLQMKRGGQEYVFTNPDTGRPFLTFKRAWRSLLKKAEIKGLRFHDLRHNFASWALMNGADLISVKETLGHESLATTSRYSHASNEAIRRLVDKAEAKDLPSETIEFPQQKKAH